MKKQNYIYIVLVGVILLFTSLFLIRGFVFSLNTKTVVKNKTSKLFKKNSSIFDDSDKRYEAFEGRIEFIEKNMFDTISYVLIVKNNKIKLDRLNAENEENESLLFDLEKGTITALHHDKRKFINVPIQPYKHLDTGKLKLVKTLNTKLISGITCYQWRVKNKEDKTEITYWVASSKYNFYSKFLQLWNKSDKCSQYFLSIPEISTMLPVQQCERTLLRDVRTSITLCKISSQNVDSSEVTIPSNYNLFTN